MARSPSSVLAIVMLTVDTVENWESSTTSDLQLCYTGGVLGPLFFMRFLWHPLTLFNLALVGTLGFIELLCGLLLHCIDMYSGAFVVCSGTDYRFIAIVRSHCIFWQLIFAWARIIFTFSWEYVYYFGLVMYNTH